MKTYAKLQLLLERNQKGKFIKVGASPCYPKSAQVGSHFGKYLTAIVFHVHKGVTMSDIYLDVTFYQRHSWRGDTHIGTARLKPSEAGPERLTIDAYLEDHRVQSEWDTLARDHEQSPIGREQLTWPSPNSMVRHRDGSGSWHGFSGASNERACNVETELEMKQMRKRAKTMMM